MLHPRRSASNAVPTRWCRAVSMLGLGLVLSLLPSLLPAFALASSPPQFVIVHLDAVAGVDLDRLMAAGHLPNLSQIFAHGLAFDAVTTFLPATPVIYSRLHDRADDFVLRGISFGGLDRDSDRVVARPEVVRRLLATFPRRALTATLHGATDLDGFAGLAMLNLPDLLERYGTVELFWFSTDLAGHLFGREGHEASLRRFDAHLGRALDRLDLETVNVVLYTDHGMTFSTETFDVDALVDERLGEAIRYFHYPNVYLHDPTRAPELARRVTENEGLDFAFYRTADGAVEGYLDGAFLRFEQQGDTIRYEAGGDPLEYAAWGYDGAWLTRDEWVELTVRAHYPATPVVIVDALEERHAGDLVVGINPPRNPHHNPHVSFSTGSHWGLVQTDLAVKVLARGPDVEPLREQGLGRLQDLHARLPALTFGRQPERELHQVALRWRFDEARPSTRLRLSPAYRARLGLDLAVDQGAAWAEYDAFSTYLMRWWLGAGATLDADGVAPMARVEVEFDVAETRLRFEASVRPSGWQLGAGASYRVAPGFRLALDAPLGVGASYEW